MLYSILLNIHSVLRWIILIIILITIIKSLAGWLKKQDYTVLDDKLSLFSLIFMHTQFILGIALFFISPIVKIGLQNMSVAMKNPEIRFWIVEHTTMMLIAVALITIGRISSKKKSTHLLKNRTVFIYFTLALIIILAGIPWDRV